MGYIDVIIPLVAGVTMLATPDAFVKPSQPNYLKKTRQFRIGGYVLLFVSLLYFVVKVFFR